MFLPRICSHFLKSSLAVLLIGCGGTIQQDDSQEVSGAEAITSKQEALEGSSCYDQCYHASLTCQQDCGMSWEECEAATDVCYDSCNQGVGPWLPC